MSSHTRHAPWLAVVALSVLAPAGAQTAVDPDLARKAYAEAGFAQAHTRSLALGLNLPWDWEGRLLGGRLTAHWDAYLSQWRTDSAGHAGQRESLTQAALVPVLRLRFDEGRSPWFIEGGIGVSVMDVRYRIPGKAFSTRFNFADHQSIGLSFGPQRRHELVLSVKHVSNAGIKKPNPGEDFIQIRYAVAF